MPAPASREDNLFGSQEKMYNFLEHFEACLHFLFGKHIIKFLSMPVMVFFFFFFYRTLPFKK